MRSSSVKPEDMVALLKTETPHNREPEEPGFWKGDYQEARRLWEREYLTRKLREFGGTLRGLRQRSAWSAKVEKIRTLGVLRR